MSYKPPHVSVTQILTRASQNLVDSKLLPTFVGSLNQVVKRTLFSLTYPVSNVTLSYLGLKPGAIINTSSVKIDIDNAVIEISSQPATGTFTVGSNILNDTGAFIGVNVGDYLVLPLNGGTYNITKVNSVDQVVLDQVVSFAPTSGNYSIRRLLPTVEADFGAATFGAASFTITQLKYAGLNILSGTSYLSYVALRKDLTGYYIVTNYDQLIADMDIDPLSGIGFYLGQIALAANGGTTVLAYITPDNNTASFLTAYSDLAIRKDVYFVVPISTDPTVNGGAASHVEAMADPDVAYFRMAMLNAPITLSAKLVSNRSFTAA